MKKWPLVSLAAAGASFGLLALLAASVLLHLTSPSDGARLTRGVHMWDPDGIRVMPLREEPGGLKAGDIVIAIDGWSMESLVDGLLDLGASNPKWEFGQTITYTVLREGDRLDLPLALGRYPLGAILSQDWGAIFAEILTIALTAFVFFRRPADRAARALFLATAGILSSATWSLGLQVGDLISKLGFWLYFLSSMGGFTLLWVGALHFALVFPQPHPVIERRRWIIPAIYFTAYAVEIAYIQVARVSSESTFAWLGRANGAVGAIQVIYPLLAVAALITGYRATHDHVSRLRVRWIAYAFILVGTLPVAFGSIPELVVGYPLLSWNAMALFGLMLPVAIVIAILRHGLFDIDLVVNRTLVYGTLTALVVGVYVVVVGYLGAVFQARGGLTLSLLATGTVAVLFQPLRERLQGGVNRLMYGDRNDPYEVLSRLGQRLEGTLSPSEVLPTIVETVSQALKLPYVAIALRVGDDFEIAAAFGLPVGDSLPLRLMYQGQAIGRLILAARVPGETFTPGERRLLQNIAHQAGVAVHAVRLAGDLQRSRERLVTTREEERRRLRRDLHDGLGPHLASLSLKLDAARNLIKQNPAAADALLLGLKQQVQDAIADIRRLVYNLRPPALDELGLLSALRADAPSYHRAGSMRVVVEGPETMPPLPAAVEVAAYRIVQEAVTNAARHGCAEKCVVHFALDEGLHLEVLDDGVGLPEDLRSGVGLASMNERACELGGTFAIETGPQGGTRVHARLPLAGQEA